MRIFSLRLNSTHLARLTNLGLRGSSLVFRFLLSIYVIKYLGLEAAGFYGLAMGVIAILPVFTSFGLNYYLSRDMVGVTIVDAMALLKTRLVLSVVVTLAVGLVGLLLCWPLRYTPHPVDILVFMVALFEVCANDIHVALISIERPTAATLLVAVRLALWAPFVMVAGILVPELRTIEALFTGYLLTYVVYVVLLGRLLRDWPLDQLATLPLRRAWVIDRAKRSWFIFLSELGSVGFNQVDRYVVSFMLGLQLTGLYTFYWSLSNSLQTLIGTAIIDFALPGIYKSRQSGSTRQWSQELLTHLRRAFGYATILAIGIYVASEVLIALLGMAEIAQHRLVLVLLLSATVFRSASDLLNIGLRSIHKDVEFAFINVGSLLLSTAITATMIWLMGFDGVGYAAVISTLVVWSARAIVLIRYERRATAQEGGAKATAAVSALPGSD